MARHRAARSDLGSKRHARFPIDIVILFFGLGAFAGLVRSDLRLPEALYDTLTIYLLLAIGLKGGVELARADVGAVFLQAVPIVSIGLLLPFAAFPVLRWLGRLPVADAASIAAHYGSVSVATFAVGLVHLESLQIASEAYLPVFMVLLEIPAIAVGIWLARRFATASAEPAQMTTSTQPRTSNSSAARIAHEVFLNKGILLMGGGLLIGAIAGPTGIEPVAPLFIDGFKGALALFLVEMGMIAASRLADLRASGMFLIAFGIAMPLFGACVGWLAGSLAGLTPGGVAIIAVLGASASYIAVPAAMRIAIPEARPALSITTSLAVTFPFNVLIGIPLYVSVIAGGSS